MKDKRRLFSLATDLLHRWEVGDRDRAIDELSRLSRNGLIIFGCICEESGMAYSKGFDEMMAALDRQDREETD